MHLFFLGNLWLEERSYQVCTDPTATELSYAAHGTGGHQDLGAIDASQDELFEKLQVPEFPAPSYENDVVQKNSCLLLSGGQIAAFPRAGGASPCFVPEILPQRLTDLQQTYCEGIIAAMK